MTWAQVGWVIIILAAVLLVVFRFIIKDRFNHRVRKKGTAEELNHQRLRGIERGLARHVILGDRFWSRVFPGLGLHALTVLPSLVKPDDRADGGQVISGGSGALVVFAQQIVQGGYQGGFSEALTSGDNPVALPGVTPLSYLAGLLLEFNMRPLGSLALFGNYGSTAVLWTEAAHLTGAHIFAGAGSLTAQAALYLNVHDLLIGEEIFLLPGLIDSTPQNQAGLITEDFLRVSLIVFLVIAAILKMVGVL